MATPVGKILLMGPNYPARYGVVEHWAGNEASGAALATISAANALTDNNTVTSNPGKVYATARQFTAANSEYLSLADNAAISMGAGVRMMGAVWVYADTFGNRQIVGQYTATGNQRGWDVSYNSGTSRFYFEVSATGSSTLTTVSADTFGAPSLATWYLIVYGYDGALLYVSVNGGAFDTAAFSADIFDSTGSFVVGASNDGTSSFWNGRTGPVTLAKNPPGGVTLALLTEFRDRNWNGGAGRPYPWR